MSKRKTNKMTRAPSKPGHLLSLISLHCLPEEGLGPQLPIEPKVKTDKSSDWVDAKADPSLLGAQVILLILLWSGSVTFQEQYGTIHTMAQHKL